MPLKLMHLVLYSFMHMHFTSSCTASANHNHFFDLLFPDSGGAGAFLLPCLLANMANCSWQLSQCLLVNSLSRVDDFLKLIHSTSASHTFPLLSSDPSKLGWWTDQFLAHNIMNTFSWHGLYTYEAMLNSGGNITVTWFHVTWPYLECLHG